MKPARPARYDSEELQIETKSAALNPEHSEVWIASILEYLKTQFRGKDDLIELCVAAFLARGHVLLEGPPGTGKTSLSKALAQAFGGSFARIQMTSDLLPSDIVGLLRLKPGSSEFEFRPGPIFTHFLLADELNRTGPKTQSALLESMAEGTVTVDGKTHRLPDPFFVIATQNPLEFHGVYPLAESQLDRFMIQLNVSSPDKEAEVKIYASHLDGSLAPAAPEKSEARILNLKQTQILRDEASQVFIEPSILEYVTDLVRATRYHQLISHGVSIRGGLHLISAAKALALVRGRKFVVPKDIADLAIPVIAHRLFFAEGDPEFERKAALVRELLDRIQAPR